MNVKNILEKLNIQLEKNVLVIIGSVIGTGVLIGCLMGGYYLYERYQRSQAQDAQFDYAQVVERFQRALEGADCQEWMDIAELSKKGYEQHAGNELAPLFLAWQSQSLDQAGNTQDALTVQEKLVNELDTSSPMHALFATKFALMLLDQEEAQQKEKGIQLLQDLGSQENNKNRDVAQYYLGEYYASIGEQAKAQEIWRTLVDQYPPTASSVWAEQAQQYLA